MMTKIKSMKQIFRSTWMVLVFLMSIFLTSCNYDFDLPDANSKPDETPPTASFAAASSTIDGYLTYNFANLSDNGTDYEWDFGDGSSSTEFEPTHVYAESPTDEEGTPYVVTLTIADKLNAVSAISNTITVMKPAIPPAIIPEILNGDFEQGTSGWKPSSFSGPFGNTKAFNASSDGSPENYEGVDTGSKTKGAKYTGGSSAGPSLGGDSRFAYQAITVTPNTEYTLEYAHAIKTDKDDIEGGDRVIVEILDGWFDDGADAYASTPLVQATGSTANGKGNFEVVSQTFTSNDSGQIAIWIYAITKDELYVDNVKVNPVEE